MLGPIAGTLPRMEKFLQALLAQRTLKKFLRFSVSRFHEFTSDDRLKDQLSANINSAVTAMARGDAEERSLQHSEAVRNLVDFLKRIQATQQDILLNSDKTIEYQVMFYWTKKSPLGFWGAMESNYYHPDF